MSNTIVHDTATRIVSVRNAETRRFEFDLFVGDEYIGTAGSYLEGEERLNELLTARATRRALEAAMDEQAADLALTRAVFDAQGIRLAAEDAAPVGQCAACQGPCDASDLYCSDACCDALSVAQLVEDSEEGWRVAPSYPLAVRCSAPGVRVVPEPLPVLYRPGDANIHAYLADGSVWEVMPCGKPYLVKAPARYAAALARKERAA